MLQSLVTKLQEKIESKAKILLYAKKKKRTFVNLSAFSIISTIKLKLRLRHRMDNIIKSLMVTLANYVKTNVIFGYKLRIAGRYQRSSRSNLFCKSSGTTSNSTLNIKIDYAYNVFKGRYGVFGIKFGYIKIFIKINL